MTTDPIVIQLDQAAAKLLLEQRDQYIRQNARRQGGGISTSVAVRRTEVNRY